MYYIMTHFYGDYPTRIYDGNKIDRQGVWWNDGAPFTKSIHTPIEVHLKPYEPLSWEQSTELPTIMDALVLFMRDDLIETLRSVGVDNLDVYDAVVCDPDDGRRHTNYKAVNIIGMIAAADMNKSDAVVHDGIPLVDVSFDKLVIDPSKAHDLALFRLAENNSAIVAHERIKEAVLARGIKGVKFFRPENVAL
jgi:hypothetical protein